MGVRGEGTAPSAIETESVRMWSAMTRYAVSRPMAVLGSTWVRVRSRRRLGRHVGRDGRGHGAAAQELDEVLLLDAARAVDAVLVRARDGGEGAG